MNRRDFIKSTVAGTAVTVAGRIFSETRAADPAVSRPASSNPALLARRPYGRDGDRISIVGLGGIVVMEIEQERANRIVAEAVERGVNYFDVAPGYKDAEIKLGPALKPYRKNAFLACKTARRDAQGAAAELKESLRRLRTDHLDLYQMHGIGRVVEDVDAAFRKGGAMEVFLEAKRIGQVRHLGFSAHTFEAARAAMERYDFDSILFPLNFACWHKGHFGPQFVELVKKKNATGLALKTGARQKWPKDDPLRNKYAKCWYQPLTDPRELELSIRFSLSQPIAAAVPPGDESMFRLFLDTAMGFSPIRADEEKELMTLAERLNPIFIEA